MLRLLNMAVVAALLSIGAGVVQAGLITFEAPTYATGQLDGQDGWGEWDATSSTENQVLATTGSGLYVGGQAVAQSSSNQQTSRQFDLFGGPGGNTFTFDILASSSGSTPIACINGTSQLQMLPATPKYGPLVGTRAGAVYIRTIGATDYTVTHGSTGYYAGGAAMTSGHWYQMTATYDATANIFSVAAVDLTAGGAAFTTGFESGIATFLNVTTYPDAASRQGFIDSLGYTAIKFVNNTGGRIDNITSVPEPGTVVLLATCLIGALAYVWRKRV